MTKRRMFSLVTAAVVAVAALAAALGSIATGSSAATAVAPSNTAPPTISGTTTVGHTLQASKGTWTGTDPITYSYRWLRCDQDGGSCAQISGATDSTYTLKAVDRDNTLRVRVTASNASGNSSATSVPTGVVKAAPTPPVTGCPSGSGTLGVGSISAPARLNIDQTQINPSGVTFGTRSVVMRFHVTACGNPVQGALVYATVVPYGQFGVPNEQATGSDGWATIDFSALTGFPVSQKQRLIVTFVRARKPGDNVLGGISTRRLVSFHVGP